jgi:hypothetical protein
VRSFSIIFFCLLTSLNAFAQIEKAPYLRLITNGYAVLASPDPSITLTPASPTQLSLSPHLVVETNLSSEQIQVQYDYKGKKRFRSIMLSQQSAEPFVRFRAIDRLISNDSETVTIEMLTNVPERVITDSKAFINGQQVNLTPNKTYTFTAFHPVTVIEGFVTISNSSAPVTGKNRLYHPFEPDTGCNLLNEDTTFYALCFTNHSGQQSAQFYLNNNPVGSYGELRYVPDMVKDITLVYSVGDKEFTYAIEPDDEDYILLLRGTN